MRVVGVMGFVTSLAIFPVAVSGQVVPEPFVAANLRFDATIEFASRSFDATSTLLVRNWSDRPASRFSFLLGRLMEVTSVKNGSGASLPFKQDVVRLSDWPIYQVAHVAVELPAPVRAGDTTTLRIAYGGNIVGYSETGMLYVRDRIDTSFTILRSESLVFPEIAAPSWASMRASRREPFTYQVALQLPRSFVVSTGGRMTKEPSGDSLMTWRIASEGPVPFLNVAIARYGSLSAPGIRISHFAADSAGARRLLANAQSAMALLTRWFGPLRSQQQLTISEIPDGWGSQADLTAGIIQSASAFRDTTRVSELYHELTHLWNVDDTDAPSPRWNEGLASFVEDLLRERINGWTRRAIADSNSIAYVRQLMQRDSLLRVVPMADYGKRQMTDYAYSVGGIMFSTMYQAIGERDFLALIGGFYQSARAAGTRDFIEYARRTAPPAASAVLRDWLTTTRWTELIQQSNSPTALAEVYRAKN